MLANGGQLFAGGNYVSDKSYVPYRHRCHVFVFPSDATKFDHHDQEIIGPMNADKEPYTAGSPFPTSFGDGAVSRSGPYENFYMSQDPCDTENTAIDPDQVCVESAELECEVDEDLGAEICVKSPSQSEELCAGSDVTLAEAQSECSALADAKFYVLVNWGEAVKNLPATENLHCHPHSAGKPNLYICAVHYSSHTWMVAYTIATHDATPVYVEGRYYLGIEKDIDPSNIGDTWDNAPHKNTYAVQKFTIVRAVKRPTRSLPPSCPPPPPPYNAPFLPS